MSHPTDEVLCSGMELNHPDVVAEVTEAFMRYQRAVDTNDVAVMNELFWKSPVTVRFGPNGTLVGHASIAGYRSSRTGRVVERKLRNTVITTFGRNFATTNTEATRDGVPGVTRQSQSWIRSADGWRIAAAHVSDEPRA
jgi:hypothetical protein